MQVTYLGLLDLITHDFILFYLSKCAQYRFANRNQYTRDVVQAALALRKWRPFLRPIVKYFIPQVKRVWAGNTQATNMLRTIVKQRMLDEKFEGYEKPIDTIEWIRDLLPKAEKQDYTYIAILQLSTGAASIYSASSLLTNALYNLAAYPEYVSVLREEAQQILCQNGGQWTLESMSQLKKMDSFLKESQRHFTATVISFQRKTLKPITLSDGTYLPANTYHSHHQQPSPPILQSTGIQTSSMTSAFTRCDSAHRKMI